MQKNRRGSRTGHTDRRAKRRPTVRIFGIVELLEARRMLSGNIFVTDNSVAVGNSVPDTVGKYTTSGQTVNASLVSGLTHGSGIAISGSDLFVTNWGAFDDNTQAYDHATIDEYTTSGAVVQLALIANLIAPQAIAISGSNIFVAEDIGIIGTQSRIAEFTTSGVSVNPSLITGLNNPVALATYGSNLFVLNSPRNSVPASIGEYTTSGTAVNATLVSGVESSLGPWGIAANATDVFVTTGPFDSVSEYTTAGATVNLALISGLDHPSGIAVVGSDLFVEENHRGRIGEYTTSGATVNAALIQGPDQPTGIVVTGDASQTFATLSNGLLTITGTTGADTITLQPDGNGNVTATLNDDTTLPFSLSQITAIAIYGLAGNDTITLNGVLPPDSVFGGGGNDSIIGSGGDDYLDGGFGNDTILGLGGNDTVFGRAGDDSLVGGGGNDVLGGGGGNDTLSGGFGNDTLYGAGGNNLLVGGPGDDLIYAIGNNAADIIWGGAGNDTAHVDQNLDIVENSSVESVLFV